MEPGTAAGILGNSLNCVTGPLHGTCVSRSRGACQGTLRRHRAAPLERPAARRLRSRAAARCCPRDGAWSLAPARRAAPGGQALDTGRPCGNPSQVPLPHPPLHPPRSPLPPTPPPLLSTMLQRAMSAGYNTAGGRRTPDQLLFAAPIAHAYRQSRAAMRHATASSLLPTASSPGANLKSCHRERSREGGAPGRGGGGVRHRRACRLLGRLLPRQQCLALLTHAAGRTAAAAATPRCAHLGRQRRVHHLP